MYLDKNPLSDMRFENIFFQSGPLHLGDGEEWWRFSLDFEGGRFLITNLIGILQKGEKWGRIMEVQKSKPRGEKRLRGALL